MHFTNIDFLMYEFGEKRYVLSTSVFRRWIIDEQNMLEPRWFSKLELLMKKYIDPTSVSQLRFQIKKICWFNVSFTTSNFRWKKCVGLVSVFRGRNPNEKCILTQVSFTKSDFRWKNTLALDWFYDIGSLMKKIHYPTLFFPHIRFPMKKTC